jgi:BirA family biotin operon repressor/biotin-[acetyl-CoA-carboxylase] ligase
MLLADDIRNGLSTRFFGKKIYAFETIDSTNNCAQMLGEHGAEEGIVVTADRQTKGRGRLGRMWEAEAGRNILFSLVLRPKFPLEQVGLIGFLVSVSIAETIERKVSRAVEVKWPNDLLINGKKFCGTLLEASFKDGSVDFVIAGVGLNVNQSVFPKKLKEKATSLVLECEKEFDRAEIFRDILGSLESDYLETREHGFTAIVQRWIERCHMFDREIKISQHDKTISGKVVRLSPDGALIIRLPDNREIKVMAGDATIVS